MGQRKMRRTIKYLVIFITLLNGTTVYAAEWSYMLSYVVPVQCTITYGPGAGSASGGEVELGSIHEYCNAVHGYDLVVHYSPGTLEGSVLIAGEDQVTLDGSGTALVERSPIPRNRNRSLAVIPGPNGLDADHLDFELVAA
jgi:hypothetical protein